ncbi:MAG TPA: HDOD domain-containing protein [Candidatus Acidoferrum sp.]|nr:HDOD domain-containing protein [Candidatus Acidoferrum sp.]
MPEKFIARQPILDTKLCVFAYELLFRGGPKNVFHPYANASSSVIADSITLFDLQMLTGAARAFVNVDEVALRLGAARLLPADRIVVEILETVQPTEEIVNICRKLRSDGYELALDDFTDEPALAPLVDMAQYLKVDFQLLDSESRERVARKYRGRNLALLAEKVETRREMEEARNLGFRYFQGYFFCKPSMMKTRNISGNKFVQMQLISAVAKPELDYQSIEELLKQDPSLLYRLLRYLNSPVLGLCSEVRSIRHAITLLGDEEFRRWASIFAIVSMLNGNSPELIRTALTRAYFCEEFSTEAGLGEKSYTLFLMGLLSISDALLDRPLHQVLDSLSVSQELKTALCGGSNRLNDVFQILLAMERAEWPKLTEYAARLGCREESIPDSYQQAIQKAATLGA